MIKQKIINQSLEILIKFAENSIENAKESVKILGYSIEDYSEDCIILQVYKDKYNKLKKQFNTFEYVDWKDSD